MPHPPDVHRAVSLEQGRIVDEILENQRYWGVMWGPAFLPGYDWPGWSDVQGGPIHMAKPPSLDGEGGWFVVRLPSTDHDGWVYGTTFDRLCTPRPGGRASKRVNDHVRSRVWRRLDAEMELRPMRSPASTREAPTAEALAQGHGAPLPGQQHVSSTQILSALTSSISYNQLPKPSLYRMWQSLMELWNESSKRHGVLKVIPLDPLGLYIAMRQHAAYANELRATALQHDRLLAHAPCLENPPPVPAPAAAQAAGAAATATTAGSGLLTLPAAKPGAAIGFDLTAPEPGAQPALNTSGAAVSMSGPGTPAPGAGGGPSSSSTRTHRRAASISHTAAAAAAEAGFGTQQAPSQQGAQGPHGSNTQSSMAARRQLQGSEAAAMLESVSSQGQGGRWSETGHMVTLSPPGDSVLQAPSDVQPVLHYHQHSTPPRQGQLKRPYASVAPAVEDSGQGRLASREQLEGVAEDRYQPSAHERADVLLPDLSDLPSLLQELLTILNYARAAYGYAMAAGHLASLSSLLQMVGSSPFFNPVSGASIEANNEAIYMLAGIPQADILVAEWRNHVFRPCHFLAVDRTHKRLVLSIRGSLELGDICTDLAAAPAEWSFGGGLGNCHVHQGLMSAAQYVEQSTHTALAEAAERFPDYPLLITGHSLGAGVAAILTLIYRNGHGPSPAPAPWGPRTYCVGIACPPVASFDVACACDAYIVSLAYNMDFVTRLSHYSVELALMDMVRSSPAAQLADTLNSTLAAVSATITGKPNNGSGGTNEPSMAGQPTAAGEAKEGGGLQGSADAAESAAGCTKGSTWRSKVSSSVTNLVALASSSTPFRSQQQQQQQQQQGSILVSPGLLRAPSSKQPDPLGEPPAQSGQQKHPGPQATESIELDVLHQGQVTGDPGSSSATQQQHLDVRSHPVSDDGRGFLSMTQKNPYSALQQHTQAKMLRAAKNKSATDLENMAAAEQYASAQQQPAQAPQSADMPGPSAYQAQPHKQAVGQAEQEAGQSKQQEQDKGHQDKDGSLLTWPSIRSSFLTSWFGSGKGDGSSEEGSAWEAEPGAGASGGGASNSTNPDTNPGGGIGGPWTLVSRVRGSLDGRGGGGPQKQQAAGGRPGRSAGGARPSSSSLFSGLPISRKPEKRTTYVPSNDSGRQAPAAAVKTAPPQTPAAVGVDGGGTAAATSAGAGPAGKTGTSSTPQQQDGHDRARRSGGGGRHTRKGSEPGLLSCWADIMQAAHFDPLSLPPRGGTHSGTTTATNSNRSSSEASGRDGPNQPGQGAEKGTGGQGLHKQSSGAQPRAGHAPGGPEAAQQLKPPSSDQVVASVMSDLQDVMQEQGGVTSLSKEELSQRLNPVKLYLPGRVLWMFPEESDTVVRHHQQHARRQAQERQLHNPHHKAGAQQPKQHGSDPSALPTTSRGLRAPSPPPQGDPRELLRQAVGLNQTGSMEGAGPTRTGGATSCSGQEHVEGEAGGELDVQQSMELLEMVIAQDFVASLGSAGLTSPARHSSGGRQAAPPSQPSSAASPPPQGSPPQQQGQGVCRQHDPQQGRQSADLECSSRGSSASGKSSAGGSLGPLGPFGRQAATLEGYPPFGPATGLTPAPPGGSQQASAASAAQHPDTHAQAGTSALHASQQRGLLTTSLSQGEAPGGVEGPGAGQQQQQQQPLSGFLTQGLGKLKSTLLEKVLGKDGKVSGSGDDVDGNNSSTSGRRFVLVEADRTRFEQLALVTSCAGDHLPDTYYQALQQLYAAAIAEDPRQWQQGQGGDIQAAAPGLKSLLSVEEEGLVADSKAGQVQQQQQGSHGMGPSGTAGLSTGEAGQWAGGTAADGVDVLPPAVRSAALNAAVAQEAQAAEVSHQAGAGRKDERSSLMGELVNAFRLG